MFPDRNLLRPALPGLALAGLLLSGCYTQLATRGYAAAEAYPPAPAPDSGDSLAAAPADGAVDTLVPRSAAPTVIVNNYYDPYPTYRGYAHWEWDYPLISVGYYSSRFDRFSRPWWWDEPGYGRGRGRGYGYGNGRGYDRPIHGIHPVTPRPDTPRPSGPYKSETRLFNPDPEYPRLGKGRRAAPASPATQEQPAPQRAQPAPEAQPAQETAAPAPAPKSSAAQGDSGDDHPTLKKGRRR